MLTLMGSNSDQGIIHWGRRRGGTYLTLRAPGRRHADTIDAVVVITQVLGVEIVPQVGATLGAADLAQGAKAKVIGGVPLFAAVTWAPVADVRQTIRAVQRGRMETGPRPFLCRELVELCVRGPQGLPATSASKDALRVLVVRHFLPGHAAPLLQLGGHLTRHTDGLELRVLAGALQRTFRGLRGNSRTEASLTQAERLVSIHARPSKKKAPSKDGDLAQHPFECNGLPRRF